MVMHPSNSKRLGLGTHPTSRRMRVLQIVTGIVVFGILVTGIIVVMAGG